jgi:hypothetical protein
MRLVPVDMPALLTIRVASPAIAAARAMESGSVMSRPSGVTPGI